MQKLYKVEDLVKEVLEKKPETRSDDFILVLEVYGRVMGCIYDPLYPISFYEVMKHHKRYGFPSFHTITRCRRKLQALYPELKNKEVEIARINETKEYIEYALDK